MFRAFWLLCVRNQKVCHGSGSYIYIYSHIEKLPNFPWKQMFCLWVTYQTYWRSPLKELSQQFQIQIVHQGYRTSYKTNCWTIRIRNFLYGSGSGFIKRQNNKGLWCELFGDIPNDLRLMWMYRFEQFRNPVYWSKDPSPSQNVTDPIHCLA